MKAEEIIGLLMLLVAIFIFGLLLEVQMLQLIAMLIIGGLVFLVIFIKNPYALIGGITLIFALIVYLFYSEGSQSISLSGDFLSTILLMLVVIGGFALAYFAVSKK